MRQRCIKGSGDPNANFGGFGHVTDMLENSYEYFSKCSLHKLWNKDISTSGAGRWQWVCCSWWSKNLEYHSVFRHQWRIPVILTLCPAVKNAVPVVDLGVGLFFGFFWLQQMVIIQK